MKTLREILLDAGMKKEELDNHCDDLYVKVNEISKKIINNYEFKNNVTTFTDDIEHKLWYDIPFAYPEYYFLEKENLTIPYKFKKDLLKHFSLDNSKQIVNTLIKCMAFREKDRLNNYDSVKLEGNILEIYSKNGNGFGIDARIEEKTLGEIVS